MRKLRLREVHCFAHVLFLRSLWFLILCALMQMLPEALGKWQYPHSPPCPPHTSQILGSCIFFPAFWNRWRILWLSSFQRPSQLISSPYFLTSHISEELGGSSWTWLMTSKMYFGFICIQLFLFWQIISCVISKGHVYLTLWSLCLLILARLAASFTRKVRFSRKWLMAEFFTTKDFLLI